METVLARNECSFHEVEIGLAGRVGRDSTLNMTNRVNWAMRGGGTLREEGGRGKRADGLYGSLYRNEKLGKSSPRAGEV